MKCRYCLQQIEEKALVCPHCGANKRDGVWRTTPSTTVKKKTGRPGRFTILTAGWLFLLSGVGAILYVTMEVPLLGEIRSGAVAIVYNSFFAFLYLVIGLGLLLGTRWGYRSVFIGTFFYTVDKLAFLLDKQTRWDFFWQHFAQYREVLEEVNRQTPLEAIMWILILTMVFCWWGLAGYIYMRRAYFHTQKKDPLVEAST